MFTINQTYSTLLGDDITKRSCKKTPSILATGRDISIRSASSIGNQPLAGFTGKTERLSIGPDQFLFFYIYRILHTMCFVGSPCITGSTQNKHKLKCETHLGDRTKRYSIEEWTAFAHADVAGPPWRSVIGRNRRRPSSIVVPPCIQGVITTG